MTAISPTDFRRNRGRQFVPRRVDLSQPPAVAGVDFVQVPWPEHPTMESAARDYLTQHVIPAGCDVKRTGEALHDWLVALGPTGMYGDRDVRSLTRADGRLVVDRVLARGCSPATARKVMTLGIAALHHARKEGVIDKVPAFQKPATSSPRMRVLSLEEERRLMAATKSPRLHRFYVLALATGARARAIEELTWDRVDMARRTIDFRIPGRNHKNKRRVVVPIGDKLLVRLQAFHERRTDEYVIGLGASGKLTSTYSESKRVLARLGIKERGVARHVCRHTVATRLLQKDTEIAKVAALLGDTVSMVERVYGHLKPSDLLAAVNKLAA